MQGFSTGIMVPRASPKGYQKSWLVGFSCLCGSLGFYLYKAGYSVPGTHLFGSLMVSWLEVRICYPTREYN